MAYPAELEVRSPERIDNWRPLVQWFLAIPHLIIAGAMSYVSGALAVASWIMIVFTGRLPAGIANFQIMVLRYSQRVTVYSGFLDDTYPPFTFEMSSTDPGDHAPVTLNVTPELEARNRLTVGFRIILAIPAMIFVSVIGFVAAVLWFVAFFAVLFTGRWPEGLREFVVKSLRLGARVSAYIYLLTDEYPPFELS